MIVAISGATGIVGQFLVKRLLHDNHRVVAISRNISSVFTSQGRRLEWRKADLDSPERLAFAIDGCDALVHCAFDHIPGKYRGGEGDDPTRFWQSNFFGTMNILNIARQVGVSRTVFISSRAVFGETSPYGEVRVPIADHERPFPDTHYGALKAAIESLQLLYSDIGMCSIRPTGIFGLTEPKEQTKWWHLILDSHSDNDESSCSHVPRTEVHGDDVASAVEFLLEAPAESVCARSFNCSDIAVNEVLIRRVANRMARGDVTPLAEPLPEIGQAHHAMSSDGLKQLGWRPGGMSKFASTVGEIVELHTRD